MQITHALQDELVLHRGGRFKTLANQYVFYLCFTGPRVVKRRFPAVQSSFRRIGSMASQIFFHGISLGFSRL